MHSERHTAVSGAQSMTVAGAKPVAPPPPVRTTGSSPKQHHASGSIRVGPYVLHETLGRGNFGKVKQARHVDTGKEFAVKVVDKRVLEDDLPSNLDIRREMSILRALNHPNIIHLHEVMVSKSRVYLVMDLARGGDFFQLISKKGRLEEGVARKYFRQLVDAIDHCHQRGVYHRDLKPENILLTDDGNLKVTDFGFSAMKDHGRPLLRTNCGSPHYCAPEVWNGTQDGYDGAKADAFSLGVILFVLLAGGQPFYDDDEERLLQKVNKCSVTYPAWFSSDAKDLLSRLLVRHPQKRWSLPMVKRHIWYTTGRLTSPRDNDLTHLSGRHGFTDMIASRKASSISARLNRPINVAVRTRMPVV
jgi:5'-AMP-activated protein kinase, catalytic alpha subunit